MVAFFLSSLLSIVAFFYKNSKILLILFFLLMWILFGFNTWNADYPMYSNMYSSPIATDYGIILYEIGFKYLIYISNSLGLNFKQFYILISGVQLFFLYRFFKYFSILPALAILCFFWFYFPYEYVVLRNFFAFTIMLQGLIAVLKNEKNNKIKFVIAVLLASTIHITSLFYFLFLFAFKEKELEIKKIIKWVLVLLVVVVISHKLIIVIFTAIHKEKTLFYATSISGFIFFSSLQIINLLIVKYFFSFKDISETKELHRVNQIVMNINILMLFLIVVYAEFGMFVRMLLNMSIVNVVLITNKKFVIERNILPKIIFISYQFVLFYFFIYKVSHLTILPLFEKNSILSYSLYAK